MSIQSFKDRAGEEFFVTGKLRKGVGWASLRRVVRRKLDMLQYSTCLRDLQSPLANRLEALKGDRQGWHSVRINDQWRVVFRWTDLGPAFVAVEDYHA